MTTSDRSWGWRLGLASWLAMGGAIANSGDCALAQITPDTTLGAENSVVTPTNIDGLPTERIDGGAVRGTNLFHSFEEFSVPTGSAAYFNNAADIQNIISRVTGGSISNIDGLIRANASANLFLLNPNGIIFGPKARLDIGGSFVGSTASSLKFADRTEFSAAEHPTNQLLTVSVPLGLQFGATEGSILNQSQATDSSGEAVGLAVEPGKTLALVGGDIRLDGGILQAPGGRVELGGVAGLGTVGLFVDGDNIGLSFADSVPRADVSLTNGAYVDVSAGGGGSIVVDARSLEISGGSKLFGGIGNGLGSIGVQAGNIDINVTDKVTITGTSSTGSSSTIFNGVGMKAIGNGGDINIQAGSLSVTNGARLSASTLGQGDAGRVTIRATDTVSFDGVGSNGESSRATSNVGERAVGKGGGIDITARLLSVTNGARLSASTLGRGDAARVTIRATDTVSFDGVGSNGESSRVTSRVGAGAVGKGGGIDITTRSLSVTNGSFLSASTFGQGDAARVTIRATDTVSFDGVGSNGTSSEASSIVGADAVGKGGDIDITARSLSATNGSFLSTTAFGQGDAGRVTIRASDTVSFNGMGSNGYSSGIFSNVRKSDLGKGGDIDITTGSLSVTNGAGLSASSEGSGAAGNTRVAASSIRLENQAFLSSDTTGGQGNIFLRSGDLLLRHNSNITTNATGTASGGNITIDTDVLAALENSDISANSVNFRGGQVRINAQGIFGTQFRLAPTKESDITATGGSPEFSGTVEINTPDIDPSRGLVNLPAELVDASNSFATSCRGGVRQGESEFIITGRGGLPSNPSEALSSDAIQVDWVTLNPGVENRSSPPVSTNPTAPASAPIVEAQGWVINNKGEVVLTATAPTATPHIPWMNPVSCHTPEASS